MGALHDGHLRLIEVARATADVVVVTIFVNPLQFDRRDDFDRYPRPAEDDLDACRAAGVDTVYAPSAEEMYPEGFQTHVEPGALAMPLEGAGRQGHFRGVTTVVTKLFNATRPHLAVFGQKDYQQLAVVRRMAADLDMGIEIVAVPTVREPDGLALSSRNRRLSPAARAAAVCVPRALDAVFDAYVGGEDSVETLEAIGAGVVAAEPAARLEYLALVDASTLQPITTVDRAAVVLTAVWFDDLRLIDNHLLG
jgi:pantoate--beta-alanine ligase